MQEGYHNKQISRRYYYCAGYTPAQKCEQKRYYNKPISDQYVVCADYEELGNDPDHVLYTIRKCQTVNYLISIIFISGFYPRYKKCRYKGYNSPPISTKHHYCSDHHITDPRDRTIYQVEDCDELSRSVSRLCFKHRKCRHEECDSPHNTYIALIIIFKLTTSGCVFGTHVRPPTACPQPRPNLH